MSTLIKTLSFKEVAQKDETEKLPSPDSRKKMRSPNVDQKKMKFFSDFILAHGRSRSFAYVHQHAIKEKCSAK